MLDPDRTRTHGARLLARLPDMMSAAVIDRFGGPEVLTLQQLPVPVPDPGEVLIAVDTAGVGPWDADIRGGWYPGKRPRFPLVLGTDGAGTVAALGSRVRRFGVGDRVYAYAWLNPKGGFYAEYVAVAASAVAPVPQRLDLMHAGAMPTTGLTALQGCQDALRLKAGESVLVHGASGGVGTLAVQFARMRGARVLATASGADGVALVKKLGAEAAIDGHRADIAEAARRFAPSGLDAVLAFAGGEALDRALDALHPGGRLAYPNGVEPEPKRRRGIKVVRYDAIAEPGKFARLNRAVEQAKLKVPIAATFPLAEAAKAHERLAAGHVLGKIVLRIRG